MPKYITVPIDKTVEMALDYDEASSSQLIEITLNAQQFEALERKHFFTQINYLVGSLIDNFEDESIQDIEKLKILIDQLDYHGIDEDFAEAFRELLKQALLREVGIYFYF